MVATEQLTDAGNLLPDTNRAEAEEGKRREGAVKRDNSRLGMFIVLAVEAMFFAGILAAIVVLTSGTEESSGAGSWPTTLLSFGIGMVGLFTLELARRHAEGEMRLTAHWGYNLACLAAVGWLVVSSGTILGLGGGSFADLADLSPVEGGRLIFHTLLSLHVLATLLCTGRGVWKLLRGADGPAASAVHAEQMWCLTLAAQIALALVK